MIEFKSTFYVDFGAEVTKFIIRGEGSMEQKKSRLASQLKLPLDSVKVGNPKGHGSKFLKYNLVTLDYKAMLSYKQVAGAS